MRSSFTQIASPSPPMPPVTSAIRCPMCFSSVVRVVSGAFFRVASRRGLDRLVACVAELLRRGHHWPRVRLEPLHPLRPPASRDFLCLDEPFLRVRGEFFVPPVAAL